MTTLTETEQHVLDAMADDGEDLERNYLDLQARAVSVPLPEVADAVRPGSHRPRPPARPDPPTRHRRASLSARPCTGPGSTSATRRSPPRRSPRPVARCGGTSRGSSRGDRSGRRHPRRPLAHGRSLKMPAALQSLLEQALSLSPSDRAVFANELLVSLEPTDPRIDALRIKDARERLAAYESGELEAIPVEDLFAETDEP